MEDKPYLPAPFPKFIPMKFSSSVFIAAILFAALCGIQQGASAQCQSYIRVDGDLINANQLAANGLHLPFWLKSGQTLAADQMVNSVSVIEFNVGSGGILEFSQVLSVTTELTVPEDKTWKVESILKATSSLESKNGAVFNNSGTYTFIVPDCTSYICIEAWGAGGGGRTTTAAGGGGGGGYGMSCFNVEPSTSLTVTVGAGGNFANPAGNGGASSVAGTGVSISAEGGYGGNASTGGNGGSSITANVKIPGGTGRNGVNLSVPYFGGDGGAAGGSPVSTGGLGSRGGTYLSSSVFFLATDAGHPGGGGGGYAANAASGASRGADGKVIITW